MHLSLSSHSIFKHSSKLTIYILSSYSRKPLFDFFNFHPSGEKGYYNFSMALGQQIISVVLVVFILQWGREWGFKAERL